MAEGPDEKPSGELARGTDSPPLPSSSSLRTLELAARVKQVLMLTDGEREEIATILRYFAELQKMMDEDEKA